ncbi:MAG: hypothetical protein AAGI22_09820 [Planctomycetota bacterium]
MLSFLPLLPLVPVPSAPNAEALLAAVPPDAYLLVHCADAAALRGRAERNDWIRLLGTSHGEPMLEEILRGLREGTHSDSEGLLAIAMALDGEAALFDAGDVAGFLATPPADRAALVDAVRAWLPPRRPAAITTVDLDGGTVTLHAWPDDIEGWTGRAGHVAAFVDHPAFVAVLSGDGTEAVLGAVNACVSRFGGDARAPVVSRYLEAREGAPRGVELFADLTPLADEFERALRASTEGVLPDPTGLLGLQRGAWFHASLDVAPGTVVDCRATLHLPPDSLAARLADTFEPLPHTLPADLPAGIWCLGALRWDVKSFYALAREALESVDDEDGLGAVDAGLEAAEGLTGIDPIVDVVDQLAGDFALYFVDAGPGTIEGLPAEMELVLSLGLHASLVDGDTFLSAFEQLVQVGPLGNALDMVEISGVDAYLLDGDDETVDGGLAFLPRAFVVAPGRRVLERAIGALLREEGASVPYGSRMQALLDECAGASFVGALELGPVRRYALPDAADGPLLPALAEDGSAEVRSGRDPFDAMLVGVMRRTPGGFSMRLGTR